MPREKIPLAIGRGLDRMTGLVGVSPQAPVDVRNVFAQNQKMALRPGLSGTGYPALTWGTDLLAVQPIKATGDILFCVYDRSTYQIRIFRLYVDGGVIQSLDSPVNGIWGTLTSGAAFPIVSADEANGYVFFAHDEANISDRLPTVYYTPNFVTPATAGTLTTLTADLNGSGTDNPVYFRGVYAYLVYMIGWGYGSASDQDRGDVARYSKATNPLVWPPECAFYAGVKKVPIIGVTAAQGLTLSASGTVGTILALCKEDESYQVTGDNPDNFAIRALDTKYGAVSSRVTTNIGGRAYTWSSDGAREITANGTIPIAQPLELLSPLPSDFPTLGPARDMFVAYDTDRKTLTWCAPDLEAGQSPVGAFTLSLWNPQDPRWTFTVIEQPVSCAGGRVFSDPGGVAPAAPVGYVSDIVATDAGIATDARYRTVSMTWVNNNATGSESVELYVRVLGGAWTFVRTFAVAGASQTTTWDYALPIAFYDLAMRYVNGPTPATGYASSDPDLWTSTHAAGSKTTVTTSVAVLTGFAGVFTSSAAPALLTWTTSQLGLPYLLEKDIGAGYVTVDTGSFTSPYSYTVPAAEVGTTVAFRLTAKRAAITGTPVTCNVSMTTPTGATTLSVPSWTVNVGYLSTSFGTMALSWTAASGATNYKVERNINGAGWTTLAPLNVATTYTDTTIPATSTNVSVSYRITPWNVVSLYGTTSGVQSQTTTYAPTWVITSVTWVRTGASTADVTVTYTGAGPAYLYETATPLGSSGMGYNFNSYTSGVPLSITSTYTVGQSFWVFLMAPPYATLASGVSVPYLVTVT